MANKISTQSTCRINEFLLVNRLSNAQTVLDTHPQVIKEMVKIKLVAANQLNDMFQPNRMDETLLQSERNIKMLSANPKNPSAMHKQQIYLAQLLPIKNEAEERLTQRKSLLADIDSYLKQEQTSAQTIINDVIEKNSLQAVKGSLNQLNREAKQIGDKIERYLINERLTTTKLDQLASSTQTELERTLGTPTTSPALPDQLKH